MSKADVQLLQSHWYTETYEWQQHIYKGSKMHAIIKYEVSQWRSVWHSSLAGMYPSICDSSYSNFLHINIYIYVSIWTHKLVLTYLTFSHLFFWLTGMGAYEMTVLLWSHIQCNHTVQMDHTTTDWLLRGHGLSTVHDMDITFPTWWDKVRKNAAVSVIEGYWPTHSTCLSYSQN